jgi:cardiolipin synthase
VPAPATPADGDDGPSRRLRSAGNRLTLLPRGEQTLEAVVKDIDGAKTRVWLETYIFVPDAAGCRVLDALVRAARRGCDVILMVDRFGAYKLRDRHVRPLREAGGQAFWFNPLLALNRNSVKVTALGAHRDHRKILVVDDAVAYTGGRNVSMEWVGTGPGKFFDVMVRIEGPAARDFAVVFLDTLEDTTTLRRELWEPPPGTGDAPVEVLQLDLREKVGQLDQCICALVKETRERLLFCTPYLIPPRPILDELLNAARRGVDVQLLTAGKCDVPWVKWAASHLYRDLLDAGVTLWEHDASDLLHAKFYVADGERTIIGSYNADRWGQRFNQEVAAEIESRTLADGLGKCFRDGCTQQVTRETVDAWAGYLRLFYALMYALSMLIAPNASAAARDRSRTAPPDRRRSAPTGADGSPPDAPGEDAPAHGDAHAVGRKAAPTRA